ncbi:MAG TPA: tetratricopeptide repeat protein [Gemmataceae bacterium]|nr:tetratricopeptide repeat protein [Gemmataceae bacterium]
MARKHQRHSLPHLSLADVKARAEWAAREGRFQQALELAKQIYKVLPSPENQQLLRNAYLGRARQLREQGCQRDAVTMLQGALQLGDADPAWLEQLAEELAVCGEVRLALETLRRVSESPATGRVLGRAADAAVRQAPAGRQLLPEMLHADYDRIMQAWAHLEAGQDDQVRAVLQGIGLRSPFAEWKLLLRGFLAYYHHDDVRALENWQRLDPERLPARLAAPFRFRIDPAYRVAQQPAAQVALQKQADQLQGSPLLQLLRAIQAVLARDGSLDQAFRLAGNVLPLLRAEAPHLVPRLAACFYWAMITVGGPDDVPRYQRIFGAPADDPHFYRLNALAYERAQEAAEAHKYWQKFERDVAANPSVWPGGQADRARALIWCHMGHNAARVPDEEQMKLLPPFLRHHPGRPRPLSPSAEQCFRKSLELAPDQLEPHEALFRHYLAARKEAKAIKAGHDLLARFPDHVPTLEAMGGLLSKEGKYAEALALFQRALQGNPLDRRLRGRVGTAHLLLARAHAEAGRFDQARAEYQAALAFPDGNSASVLCKWAACEFKAGDTARGEELLGQALAESGSRLAVAHSMLIEAIRLKLPGPFKTRFNQEFNAALAEPPTAAAAVAVADTVAAHQLGGVTYRGQKTHDKKVTAYLDRARQAEFSEDQLERLGAALLAIRAVKLLRAYCQLGARKFRHNPQFPFLEAESYFVLGPSRCPSWKVLPLLDKAQRLAEALPLDEKQQALLRDIQQRRDMIGLLSPLSLGMFRDMFEQMFDGDYDDEDDYDDEGDY